MTLADLLLFLIGDAEAIRRLAADPWTPAVGALLVLSAGLARHYDAHDLLRQWWRLLVPFAVSLAAAGALFAVLVLVTRPGAAALPLGWGLLGLFWLTAPFAWLYGMPFGRLLPPRRAAVARRLTLAVVAACRVALMARCLGVLLGYPWPSALAVVACFALPVAVLAVAVALLVVRRPETSGPAVADAAREVVNFMGGVPRDVTGAAWIPPPDDSALWPPFDPGPGCGLGCLAVVLLVVSASLLSELLGPPPRRPPAPLVRSADPPAPGAWAAAAGTVLFWAPWLLLRQPAQRRRTAFAGRLRGGDVARAVRDLDTLRPADLPPGWDPAAALGQAVVARRFLEAVRVAATLPAGSWVRGRFLDGLRRMLFLWTSPPDLWPKVWEQAPAAREERMPADRLHELAALYGLLRGLPEAPDVLAPYRDYLAELSGHIRERDPARAAILEELLLLALKKGPGR